MAAYVFRRVLIAVPLLLAMTLVAFIFIQMAPGDWFDTLRLNPQISQDTIARYEALYHLDQPVLVQYFYWLGNLARGDLGFSFEHKSPVASVIRSRVGNTLILAVVSIVVAWGFSIPLGILSAVRKNKLTDRVLQVIAFIGMSIPNFFFCLLLLYAASVTGVLPLGGIRSVAFDSLSLGGKVGDAARHLVIPTLVLSTASFAGLMRVMRGTLLDVLKAPYALAARAKGLPEWKVLGRHAVPNAINPLITIFGFEFSGLLSGAAITEIILNWPGLGSLMLSAVRSQDLYLVMGSMVMGGLLLVLGNLIADCLLAWIDPRIQLR
ncbi:MAG: ABC transporter permease [Candidatus Omnitrophica bacterium]|nr:ABC transporter permease [Candidatus Omnitrophota bacterium]